MLTVVHRAASTKIQRMMMSGRMSASGAQGLLGRSYTFHILGLRPQRRCLSTAVCASKVVVVESPAKAKKIQGYLGLDFQVVASYGHVRDISTKPGSISPDEWSNIQWALVGSGLEHLNEIAKLVRKSEKLILATDPDREGEAISWHIQEELKARGLLKDVDVKRITFSEVTKKAVLEAMENPRQVSSQLVDAYLARRALDFQVGFSLSPVLWRKLPGVKSAGRVQSVALRLVCEREKEVNLFIPKEYWTVDADISSANGSFAADLKYIDGKVCGKFDMETITQAQAVVRRAKALQYYITDITVTSKKRRPLPPFTTSTLQQEAQNKLGFSPSKTDKIAQSLYVGESTDGEGLITYLRTDSAHMSTQAIHEIREVIESKFSELYIPDSIRRYKSKAKNSQEAHEAIRPTNPALIPSGSLNIPSDHLKLYGLIWKRTIASQMVDAKISQISVDITDKNNEMGFRSSDSRVSFDGFLSVYKPSDEEENLTWSAGHGDVLSALQHGAPVSLDKIHDSQHFTKPPPRYSEATLVKTLEEKGIGRPSTYSSILRVLKDRGYVEMHGRTMHAAGKGQVLTAFLMKYFDTYVDYGFTCTMESQLDSIANGLEQWKDAMDMFWYPFNSRINEVTEKTTVSSVVDEVDNILGELFFPLQEDGSDPRKCPLCEDGRLGFKPSKGTGGFIGCSNYKEKGCTYSMPLGVIGSDAQSLLPVDSLGVDPRTGGTISVKNGRFGPYLSLEPCKGSKYKPKTLSVPNRYRSQTMTLETAVSLLTPLHEVGFHPDDGDVVEVRNGRFGSNLIRHGKTAAKLPKDMDPSSVTMDLAIEYLKAAEQEDDRKGSKAMRKKGKKKRGRNAFIIYSSSRREELKMQKKKMSPTMVIKTLASEWKALSDSEKAPFVKLAEEEKARVANANPQQSGGVRDKPTKASNKKKRSNGANGYIVFGKERRPVLKEQNPNMTFGEVSKALGEMWRGLEEAEKNHYRTLGAGSGEKISGKSA